MKKIILIPLILIFITACSSNSNPYEIDTAILDNAQKTISETFLPKSIIDEYSEEDIIITHVCEAQNELERENVDYIFKYKTADNEYESEVAHFIEENEVDRPGKYSAIEDTCEEYNYQ